jgi:hypothetical protein
MGMRVVKNTLIRIFFWVLAVVFAWGVYLGVGKNLITQSVILALLSIACILIPIRLIPFLRKVNYKV